MKKFSLNSILLFVASLLVFSSCSKEDEEPKPEPLTVETASNIVADPIQIDPNSGRPIGTTGKFTLFSLREGKTIANTDSASNNWDVGFRGTTIIINGGAIRTGEGGAYLFDGLFDELTEIPESQVFGKDNSKTDLAIKTGSGNGWYTYNTTTNTINPIAGKIIVIRTGDGKGYAKIEITSYYKNAPQDPTTAGISDARHYNFRYVVQTNGTKKF